MKNLKDKIEKRREENKHNIWEMLRMMNITSEEDLNKGLELVKLIWNGLDIEKQLMFEDAKVFLDKNLRDDIKKQLKDLYDNWE